MDEREHFASVYMCYAVCMERVRVWRVEGRQAHFSSRALKSSSEAERALPQASGPVYMS